MTRFDAIVREPQRHDLFAVLRLLERHCADRPRIGENAALRQEIVRVSQNPYFVFPSSNLTRFEAKGDGWRLFAQFLGQFGPQGALPLSVTEEAFEWLTRNRDDAFPRFVDVLSNRFLQLFFRAWANARPIAQYDRPKEDRFGAYVGSHIGLGTPPFRDLDRLADLRKLALAGVLAGKAKSASRLRTFLRAIFDVEVEIEEFVGSRLTLERDDRSRLGARSSKLGVDLIVGASCFTVQDKIRIRIFTRDVAQYSAFLPNGAQCPKFVDAVYFYIGGEIDWDVELALPAGEITAAGFPAHKSSDPAQRPAPRKRPAPKDGVRLGWTSWLSPNWATSGAWRSDARFHPAATVAGNIRK